MKYIPLLILLLAGGAEASTCDIIRKYVDVSQAAYGEPGFKTRAFCSYADLNGEDPDSAELEKFQVILHLKDALTKARSRTRLNNDDCDVLNQFGVEVLGCGTLFSM